MTEERIVHPGSYCGPDGDTGKTKAGTPMVCSVGDKGGRPRWRKDPTAPDTPKPRTARRGRRKAASPAGQTLPQVDAGITVPTGDPQTGAHDVVYTNHYTTRMITLTCSCGQVGQYPYEAGQGGMVEKDARAAATAHKLDPERYPLRNIMGADRKVRDAYRALLARQGKDPGDWVSMADLREATGLPRDEFDAAIKALARDPDAQVEEETNQKSLTERDRAAGVVLGSRRQDVVAIDPKRVEQLAAGTDPSTVQKPRPFGREEAAAAFAAVEAAGDRAAAEQRLAGLDQPQLAQIGRLVGLDPQDSTPANIIDRAAPRLAARREPTAPMPEPAAAPVSGAVTDQPRIRNNWGGVGGEVNYHEDGPIGCAVNGMGSDAQMLIDGDSLANTLGRIATGVVRSDISAQEGLDRYKQVRDRLPQGSVARRRLDLAIDDMDAPLTPPPAVPDNIPEPLRDLMGKLHAIPVVRRDGRETAALAELLDQFAAGRLRGGIFVSRVRQIANRRHESWGDAGKIQIDNAVYAACNALDRLPPSALRPQVTR